MSHFILQSTKFAKITDGEKTVYLTGVTGKDNNVTSYGYNRTSAYVEHIVKTNNVFEYINWMSEGVFGGSIKLKDKYGEKLSNQATVYANRLVSGFKNAKEIKVEKINDDFSVELNEELTKKLEDLWGMDVNSRIGTKKAVQLEQDSRMKEVIQFLAKPDTENIEKIVSYLDINEYFISFIPSDAKLSEEQLYVAIRDGARWGNSIDENTNKIQIPEHATDIIKSANSSWALDEKICYVDDECYSNADFVNELIKHDGFDADSKWSYKIYCELFSNPEIQNTIIEHNPDMFVRLPIEVRNNRENYLKAISKTEKDTLGFDSELLKDREFVYKIIEANPQAYFTIVKAQNFEQFLEDTEIYEKVAKTVPGAYIHAPESIRSNPKYLLDCLEGNGGMNSHIRGAIPESIKKLVGDQEYIPFLKSHLLKKELEVKLQEELLQKVLGNIGEDSTSVNLNRKSHTQKLKI